MLQNLSLVANLQGFFPLLDIQFSGNPLTSAFALIFKTGLDPVLKGAIIQR